MAGSGKTTLMQRLNAHLHAQNSPPYVVNLDPAVSHMPYTANIDIRDTVDYKEVMRQCVPGFHLAERALAARQLAPTLVLTTAAYLPVRRRADTTSARTEAL